MPRVNHVKKCRKDQGACGRCGAPLPVGSAYRYWEFRYGGRHVRCMKAECNPRASELTQSKLSEVYAAQEDGEQNIHDWDGVDIEDLKGYLSEAAERIREVGQEYQDAADAINETAEGSPIAEENEERASELESWAEELDGWEPNEDWDEESKREEARDSLDDEATDKDVDEELANLREAWVEDARTEADDLLANCPVG